MDLRDRGFSRKLLAVLSNTGYLASLTHSPGVHLRAAKLSNVTRVTRPISLWNKRLDPLADDLVRRPAEDGLRPLVEESDALKCVHADDCIGRDFHDFCQNVVRYPVGHLCTVIPYRMGVVSL